MKKILLLILITAFPAQASQLDSGAFLDLSGAWVPLSGSDLSFVGREFPDQAGYRGMATLGWQVENGISVGFTVGMGPWRENTSLDGLETWNLRQGWVAASMEYNLVLGYSTLVGLRLTGGPIWLEGSNQSRALGEIPSQAVRSAAATAWLPELKVEKLFGHVGLGFAAGWLFSRFVEVRGILPTGKEQMLFQADGSPVVIDHSGPQLRAYIRFYLEPPL